MDEEQQGKERSEYEKCVIPELSRYLTAKLGKGSSQINLKQMQKFYQVYSHDAIDQTLSDQLTNLPAAPTGR